MSTKTDIKLEKIINHLPIQNMLSDVSSELKQRLDYKPPICSIFNKKNIIIKATKKYHFKSNKATKTQLKNISLNDDILLPTIKNTITNQKHNFTKKQKIGIVFSGGPSPAGHNVIAGLFDAIKKANKDSSLFGFVMGPKGIIDSNYIKINKQLVEKYRNLGGFTMIKTGRTKIDTIKKMNLAKKTCKELNLDALVVVGGDDSNTNAAFLAEEMFNEKTKVIGVPKTIDGDIQVKDLNNKILCATSFGFHTAAKTFSHFISNLCIDASSDVKYWHICKVMGRTSSHLALEVAFQTHPNLTLIGEELADYVDHSRLEKSKSKNKIDYSAYGTTLNRLIKLICNAIVKRAKIGKNFGVIVIPEGILEFINEIQTLIIKITSTILNYNTISGKKFHASFRSLNEKLEYLNNLVTLKNKSETYQLWTSKDHNLFTSMPKLLQEGLLTERDNHGNFQFSQIKTEEIILELVKKRLKILQKQGKYIFGISKNYYQKIMEQNNSNAQRYGKILFKNWNKSEYLIINQEITSRKNLRHELVKANLLNIENDIPEHINDIFEKSIPDFKAQTHFYGYDGRGNNPTHFDCTYAYNIGHTAFHLINNGVTGYLAAIMKLENSFDKWTPVGIPIAPLMNLEERKGKLSLVLEKSSVNIKSPLFKIFKELSKKWLAENIDSEHYRLPDSTNYTQRKEDIKPITLLINKILTKTFPGYFS